jgi:hypothetical protein
MGTTIWEIVASPTNSDGTSVNGLRLTYGQVPDGYEQTVPFPSGRAAPPPLGVVCSFFAETLNAPGAGGFIFTSPAGPVRLQVPDHCMRSSGGREIEVNCATGKPYEEPTDLDRYVREHRIAAK